MKCEQCQKEFNQKKAINMIDVRIQCCKELLESGHLTGKGVKYYSKLIQKLHTQNQGSE